MPQTSTNLQVPHINFNSKETLLILEGRCIPADPTWYFDALTELYIETLNTDRSPDRPGAGLGFIEMARRSKQKFHYQFQKVNDKLQIFSFQVTIE